MNLLGTKAKTSAELYEIVKNIADNSEVFYESTKYVDGYKTSMFDYLLAYYSDFGEFGEINRELRGLTFIWYNDKVVSHWVALDKFFNLNENPSTLYDFVKDYEILSVHDKLDGSMITPVLLPNGKVRMKTKMAFESDMAVRSQAIVESNEELYEQIKLMVEMGFVPVFEYTAPSNQIVVGYKEEKLTLLKIRCNTTGVYRNFKDFYLPNIIDVAEKFDFTLEELMSKHHTDEGVEGWIVQFTNGQIIKIKTRWYLDLHGTVSNPHKSIHTIATKALDSELDDLLSRYPEGSTRDLIIMVQDKTFEKYHEHIKTIKNVLDTKTYERKDAHSLYGNMWEFGIIMKFWDKEFNLLEVEENVVSKMKKDLFKLERAKAYLGIDFSEKFE